MRITHPALAPEPCGGRLRVRRQGFTLVELLAVIAILGVLTTLAFAAGRTLRAKGQTVRCLATLREVGAATHLYLGEHKSRLPSTSHERAEDGSSLSWTHTLAAYLGPDFLGRCPAVPDHPARITYGWNDLLVSTDGAGLAFSACRDPAATLLVAELAVEQSAEHFHFAGAARGRVTNAFFKSSVNVECHGAGANYLFVDGHVATLRWPDVQTRLAVTDGPFLKP